MMREALKACLVDSRLGTWLEGCASWGLEGEPQDCQGLDIKI
jgi:hypothetical protein